MRTTAVTVGILLGLACVSLGGEDSTQDAVVISLPAGDNPYQLRLKVSVDGRSSTVSWDRFIDRLLDYFDRDNDSLLNRDECSRMMLLPLPERKELTLNFAKADGDANGMISRVELKAFCRQGGFSPVVVRIEPPSAVDLHHAALFQQRLEVSRDGRISAEELRHAPTALRSLDFNEDEFIDLDELRDPAPAQAKQGETKVSVALHNGESDSLLRVRFGTNDQTVMLEDGARNGIKVVGDSTTGSRRLFRGPANTWMLSLEPRITQPQVKAAGDFLVAQFQTALGERLEMSLSDLRQNVTLSGLTELVRFADRSGEDGLSLVELRDYTELVASALEAQIWITVTDHGQSPFGILDTDSDGRLSYSELARAADVIAENKDSGGLPRHYEISFGAAPARAWGGMQIPTAVGKRTITASKVPLTGPKWFQALDVNRDGIVSPREFLGPAEVFRRLDADKDTAISSTEAAAAKQQNSGGGP